MVVKKVILEIFILGLITAFADELDVKNAIANHFQDKNILFLHIKKMKNGNYFVIARHKNEEDRIVVDSRGKILSITDDLSVLDEVEEGC